MSVPYSQAFLYVSLSFGFLFVIFCLVAAKMPPQLSELFGVMLAVSAATASVELCVLVLFGSLSLGDFEGAELTIILGGISVAWVSLQSVLFLAKSVLSRAGMKP